MTEQDYNLIGLYARSTVAGNLPVEALQRESPTGSSFSPLTSHFSPHRLF
jgi:hypothetical protein